MLALVSVIPALGRLKYEDQFMFQASQRLLHSCEIIDLPQRARELSQEEWKGTSWKPWTSLQKLCTLR